MDINIPLSDLIREANFKIGYYLRAAKADTRLLDCAQDMLREAESRAARLSQTGEALKLQRDDLTALREADQATIASLALVNKELADALAGSLALLADSFVSASPARRKEIQATTNAGLTALHSAGRLQEPPQG